MCRSQRRPRKSHAKVQRVICITQIDPDVHIYYKEKGCWEKKESI